MYLFESFLLGEVEELANQGVRLRLIGDRERLSVRCRELVTDAERRTRFGRRRTLLRRGRRLGQRRRPGHR